MFKTVYSAHFEHGIKSNSGLPDRPNYKPMYTDKGAYELVEDGVFHSFDDIQAWLPTCDMGIIMRQYLRTGDESILNRRAGFYADVSDLPKDYIALRNMLNDADQIFASLPLELRERFGHSPSRFYADSELASQIMDEYIKSVAPPEPIPVPDAVISPVTSEEVIK